jgi:hypothetical protein
MGAYNPASMIRRRNSEPETDLDFLRFVVWDRDLESARAIQCDDYQGPDAEEILRAVENWGEEGSKVIAIAVPKAESPEPNSGDPVLYQYEVELESGQSTGTTDFEVVVAGDCIAEVRGGDELLGVSGD